MASAPAYSALVARQHIQDHDAATEVRHHWGYADRVIPCVNDPGSCEYLDVVYDAHDVGMIYSGAFWATVGFILLVWAIVHHSLSPLSGQYVASKTPTEAESGRPVQSTTTRMRLAAWSHVNRYLLPDSVRSIFGRTTRLQVLILAVLTGYLTVFSFAGIVYNTWVTPVSDMEGVYNTRTSLGPWSDRVGVLAYALTPLSVLLANRESLLSVLTGIPYQNFNFLHRWLGYIIVVQSVLHTIGWTIIEVKLYQPQPTVAENWIKQLYMIWGCVAIILLLILYILSLPPVIRLTGYEFFRKSHYILAMVYIGACIGHWEQLQCFLIPGILLWFFDRVARGVRTFLLHYNFVDGTKRGFVSAQAAITTFPNAEEGDIVRMDFEHPQDAWANGQHYYLCFPESSLLQSHPFTPLNAPVAVNGRVKHAYIFRAKKGETKKIADIAAKKIAAATTGDNTVSAAAPTTPVILTGPYGDDITRNVSPDVNILCLAGGTGITYVLPALLSQNANLVTRRKMELLWVVRHASDADWVRPELDQLAELGVTVRIHATRDSGRSTPTTGGSIDGVSSEMEVVAAGDEEKRASAVKNVSAPRSLRSDGTKHPNLTTVVSEFVEGTAAGRTVVFASGPGGLMTDARAAVAACNDGSKVWKGEERYSVDLVHDERMER